MMFGMPPSHHHRFYLAATDTLVELRWSKPVQPVSRGIFARLAAFLSGPRPEPWHMVDHATFDHAVDTLAVDADKALAAFNRLGYDVEVHEPELRAAA